MYEYSCYTDGYYDSDVTVLGTYSLAKAGVDNRMNYCADQCDQLTTCVSFVVDDLSQT